VPFDAPCAALGLSRASVHGSDRRRAPLSPKGQGIFSGFPDFPASCLHSSRPPRSARFTRRGKSRCADATRPFPRPDSSRARGARCRTSAGSARRLRVSHAPTPRGGRARAAVALGTILLSSACPSGRLATSRRCASSATEAREILRCDELATRVAHAEHQAQPVAVDVFRWEERKPRCSGEGMGGTIARNRNRSRSRSLPLLPPQPKRDIGPDPGRLSLDGPPQGWQCPKPSSTGPPF
jgi:hypothetical protein